MLAINDLIKLFHERKLWGGGHKIARKIIRILYACDFPLGSDKIGNNLFLAHNGLGIVISSETKIGDNCKIYQNVTLGAGKDGYPEIGDNVTIYSNSVVIGKIKIGDNSIIGACFFVNKDVEANTVVAGNPAKVIRRLENDFSKHHKV